MACAFCYYGVVLISTEILGENSKSLEPLMASNSYLNTSLDGGFSANQSGFSLNMLPSPQSLVDDQNETLSDMVCKNPAHKMLSTSDYVKLLWTTLAEFPGMTFCSQYLRVKKLMYCSKAYVFFF